MRCHSISMYCMRQSALFARSHGRSVYSEPSTSSLRIARGGGAAVEVEVTVEVEMEVEDEGSVAVAVAVVEEEEGKVAVGTSVEVLAVEMDDDHRTNTRLMYAAASTVRTVTSCASSDRLADRAPPAVALLAPF